MSFRTIKGCSTRSSGDFRGTAARCSSRWKMFMATLRLPSRANRMPACHCRDSFSAFTKAASSSASGRPDWCAAISLHSAMNPRMSALFCCWFRNTCFAIKWMARNGWPSSSFCRAIAPTGPLHHSSSADTLATIVGYTAGVGQSIWSGLLLGEMRPPAQPTAPPDSPTLGPAGDGRGWEIVFVCATPPGLIWSSISPVKIIPLPEDRVRVPARCLPLPLPSLPTCNGARGNERSLFLAARDEVICGEKTPGTSLSRGDWDSDQDAPLACRPSPPSSRSKTPGMELKLCILILCRL
mmetsp:Transcript_55976/g.99665  ORF Transcript_55976/g.99665 Transcript_55976/m.99665 type:complete len:296 (+) Transcript_55976:46-933(+)